MPRTMALIRASILVELRAYVEARGLAFEPLLDEAGLPADVLATADQQIDPLGMVPLDAVTRIFDLAAARLDDPCFGLRAARSIKLPGISLLGQLTARAPTVRDALKCAAGYANIFITRIEAGFSESNGVGRLYWRQPPNGASPIQFNAFLVAGLILRLRRAAGPDWVPIAVELPHRALECREAGLLVFGERVRYDCAATCLVIDAKTLGKPMPDADPTVFAYLKDLAERWLKEIGPDYDAGTLVSHELAARLKVGGFDLGSVATALNMNPRTLQWRLERLGTSFEKIVNDTRADLAVHLLRDTDLPLKVVALELGFSDASAFSRASRRWFHMPPRAYRQLHRRNVAAATARFADRGQ